jgi:hypothetical protein
MLKHETAWNEFFSVTDIFNRKHHILGHANSKPLPHPPQQKSLNPLKIKALKMAPAVGIEPTTYFTAAQYLSGFQSSVGTFRVTSRSYCLH